MCGRFALHAVSEEMENAFQVSGNIDPERSYNIPPGQKISTVRQPDSANSSRELTSLTWGLVPHWAEDRSVGNKLINARSETVDEKPSFRDAFRKRRCLIPASGFYEWKQDNGRKQPFYIQPDDSSVFAFAGLWDRWEGQQSDEEVLETCTILTTEPNRMMKPIHNRMPVILHPARYDAWLNPDADSNELLSFLTPYQSDRMEAYPVGSHVNNPENDDPTCIEPIE